VIRRFCYSDDPQRNVRLLYCQAHPILGCVGKQPRLHGLPERRIAYSANRTMARKPWMRSALWVSVSAP
jgi:hypothetical protein